MGHNTSTLLKALSWSLGMGLIALNYNGVPILGDYPSFLALALIVAPAVVSILQEEEARAALCWIVLLSISLRLILPLSEGRVAFMLSSDAKYSFQLTDIYAEHGAWIWGLETERARHLVFFPGLQILSVQVSTLTGLSLYQVCRFLPVLFSAVTIIVVFQIYSLMLSRRVAIAASFLFSVCYKYNWFDGFYIQESLGILFFVMAFYFITWAARGTSRPRFSAMVLLSTVLALVMTHFFSSLMLGLTLVSCYALFFMVSRIGPKSLQIRSEHLLVALVLIAGWVSFVGLAAMVTGIRYGIDYLSSLHELLAHPIAQGATLEPTGIHLTIEETIVVYLGFLLTGGAGLLGMARGIRAIKKAAKLGVKAAAARMEVFCAAALLLGGLAFAGFFSPPESNPDIPSRLIPFVYFFWSPAFGVGILYARRHLRRLQFRKTWVLQRRIILANFCVAILLILPAASTWLLLPSTMQGRTTLDDVELTALSSWLRSSGDQSAFLLGEPVTTLTVASLARFPSFRTTLPGLPTNDVGPWPVAGMLYYGGNMTSKLFPRLTYFQTSEIKNQPVYLLVNELYLSHKYYLITYLFEGRPPPSEEDIASSFDSLKASPVLDRIYCNSAVSIYLSTPR